MNSNARPASLYGGADLIALDGRVDALTRALEAFGSNVNHPNHPSSRTPLAFSEAQLGAMFAPERGFAIDAPAGTGKSTLIAMRALAACFVFGADSEHIRVIADSFESRQTLKQTIDTFLTGIAPHFPSLNAPRIRVSSLGSAVLDLCRDVIAPATRLFDLIGKVPGGLPPGASKLALETLGDAAAFADETALNASGPSLSDGQRSVLRKAYEACYAQSEEFRTLLDILRVESMRTEPLDGNDDDLREAMSRLDQIAKNDEAFCEQVERDWSSTGLWPIPGVETRNGPAYALAQHIDGHVIRANGYLPATRTFVILGARSKIRERKLESPDARGITLSRMSWSKSRIALGKIRPNVLYINTVVQLKNLARQARYLRDEASKTAPDMLVVPPGEFSVRSLIDVLYETGAYAERQCRDPRQLNANFTSSMDMFTLALARATEIFYSALYEAFDRDGMISLSLAMARLSSTDDWLQRLTPRTLASVQHLLFDDFQNIAPSHARLIKALHARHLEISPEQGPPTLFACGDSWQAVGNTQGALPTMLTAFDTAFPGSKRALDLLRDDYRSPQQVIDCAESIVLEPNRQGGVKKGTTARPSPIKRTKEVVAIDTARVPDVIGVLKGLLDSMTHDERLMIVSQDTTSEVYIALTDYVEHQTTREVTMRNIHDALGTESDYVFIVGDCASGTHNALRNALHARPAGASRDSYDALQNTEAVNLAYLALTRARRAAVWICHPYADGAFSRLAGQSGNCVSTHPSGALRLFRRWAASHDARNTRVERNGTIDAVRHSLTAAATNDVPLHSRVRHEFFEI
ncbi:MAG TPA: hypothetical protein VL424_14410 [Pararobbsia sp.]|nr:hypothetical protein [Pararobbsia sp.]